MENKIEKKEVEKFKVSGSEFYNKVKSFEVNTALDQSILSEFLQHAKEKIKFIELKFEKSIDSAKKAKAAAELSRKNIVDLKDEAIKSYVDADEIAREKNNIYLREQHEIAEKQRREEEKKRREAEQKERERLERLALKQIENDKTEKAEETMEKIEKVFIAPAVIAEPERQIVNDSGKVDMTARKDIKVTIHNSGSILNAILEHKLPIKAVKISENEIKKYIKSMGISKQDAFKMGVIVEDVFLTIVRGPK